MENQLYHDILDLLGITLQTEVLWTVLPLLIATFVMLIYFEKYKEERPGWNTHVANSLVLLFVSMILFRQIYNIEGLGSINFITYPAKLFLAAALLVIGITILFLNFEHFLPEKIAKHFSSPITLNLIAYIAILFVYSNLESNIQTYIALIVLFAILLILLNIIRILLKRFFRKIRKMKFKEKATEIVADKREIKAQKNLVKREEKELKRVKSELKKKEKQTKNQKLKTLERQKREAIKLKKLVKK